jgi:hypothetical protein
MYADIVDRWQHHGVRRERFAVIETGVSSRNDVSSGVELIKERSRGRHHAENDVDGVNWCMPAKLYETYAIVFG